MDPPSSSSSVQIDNGVVNGNTVAVPNGKVPGKRMTRAQMMNLMRRNLLALATLASVLLAILLGIIIRSASGGAWSERKLMYLEFPGELFLRALKCLTIPLIVSSLVSAIGSLDLRLSGRIGKRAMIYYLVTTIMSISLGIFLVLTLHPGSKQVDRTSASKAPKLSRKTTTADTILDLIR